MNTINIGDVVRCIYQGKKFDGTVKGFRRNRAFIEFIDGGGRLVPFKNMIKLKKKKENE